MARDNEPYTPDSPKFSHDRCLHRQRGEVHRRIRPQARPLSRGLYSPHWPHALRRHCEVPRQDMKGWDASGEHERMMAMGIVECKRPLTPRDPQAPAWETVTDKDERDLRMAVYAAQIDRTTQNIGRVLAKVKELGQEDNTLILFLADNGGCAEEKIKGEGPTRPRPGGFLHQLCPAVVERQQHAVSALQALGARGRDLNAADRLLAVGHSQGRRLDQPTRPIPALSWPPAWTQGARRTRRPTRAAKLCCLTRPAHSPGTDEALYGSTQATARCARGSGSWFRATRGIRSFTGPHGMCENPRR